LLFSQSFDIRTYVCMRIFYTASFYGKNKYQKYYDLVLETIEKTGATVISPEKGNYKRILTAKARMRDPKLAHYEAIRKNILQADAVIIEVSFQDLQIGYETALAIAAKKPVLCLSIYEDFSQKIDNQYFFGAKYTELDVEEVVAEFVERVGKKTLGERFNLFLSAVQEEYLEHASREKGISKSEYVRNLIDKDKLEK